MSNYILDDLLCEVQQLRKASAVTSEVVHRLHGERERYRLAWKSASRRAAGRRQNFLKVLGVSAGRLIALDEMTQQRDEARAEVIRLGHTVDRTQQAHDELLRRITDAEDGAIGAADLRVLFDALFPRRAGEESAR